MDTVDNYDDYSSYSCVGNCLNDVEVLVVVVDVAVVDTFSLTATWLQKKNTEKFMKKNCTETHLHNYYRNFKIIFNTCTTKWLQEIYKLHPIHSCHLLHVMQCRLD